MSGDADDPPGGETPLDPQPDPRPDPRLAVALSYEAPNAPKVVAVGRGWVGEKIVETARAHGVPLRQDAALAEALATIELDQEIPEALYRAVAAVIGFILRANAAAAAGR